MSQPSHEEGFVKPKLHHVNLKTARLKEMMDWYRRVVGLEVTHLAKEGAWLSNDAANHRLALLSVPVLVDDPVRERHAGMHHTAYEFATFADLMDTFARLREIDILPSFCLDHGMTTSMYYRDPDGNFVELQTDNFGDWSASKSYMRLSPDFAANPIGKFFDPARVYDEYKAGRSFDDLHRAMMAGQFQPNPIPSIGLPPP